MVYAPNFQMQYNEIYKARLNTIRPYIQPKHIHTLDTILDLNTYSGVCCIKGIVFISSDLKTTIFDILHSQDTIKEFKKTTYISKDIKIFMEDQTGRIELKFNTNPFITTGMCLGVTGKMIKNVFAVDEVIWPMRSEITSTKIDQKKVAIISGVNVSDANENKIFAKILLDYLTFRNIEDVILIGKFCDNFIHFKKFVEGIDMNVTLVPEYHDFGSLSYPILPVHKKLLDREFTTFHTPNIVSLYGATFAFSSMYIVQDMIKYIPSSITASQSDGDGYRMHLCTEDLQLPSNVQTSDSRNIKKVVDLMLKSRHLCPNAPDTIPVAPYSSKDFFFIDKSIDYFVVPNASSALVEYLDEYNTCLLTIPNFDKTRQIVLLDLCNKDYEIIEFTE